jgi:hypothetical protein
VLSRLGLLLFDRKMPLMRPAGEVDGRERLGDGRSDEDRLLGTRFSDSIEPERTLDWRDVLEASSVDDESGSCWCRRGSE